MIVGHQKQLKILKGFVDGKVQHHGFLFHGPESVGKKTIAEAFGESLSSGENLLHEKSEKVNSDLFVVAPEKIEKKGVVSYRDISIDQIVQVKKSISLAADREAKILIINDAHRLTISAQNALLKTLEEPIGKTFIILVTHSPQLLLPTVVSRCFGVTFQPVDKGELQKISLEEKYIDAAQGRPGFLKKIIDDDNFFEVITYARIQLQELFAKPLHERVMLSAELAKKDEDFLKTFFVVWVYRIYCAAHNTKKYNLLKVADRVEETAQKIQNTNTNKQLVIEELLINIV